MNDIKKAFETFKKAFIKETGIDNLGFTMSKRQIELRTATALVNLDCFSFEEEIARIIADDEKVQAYDTWTADEKAKAHEHAMARLAHYTDRKERFGTKQNEVAEIIKMMQNSKALAQFEEVAGQVTFTIETKNDYNYIRFNY